MPRSAVLYLRVSTSQQAGDERFGFDVQRQAAERYATQQGLRLTRTYQDVITGTKATRTQLNALLEDAGNYEAVLISSVDRLARRTGIAYAVLEELLDTGMEVHSADMGVIDPKDEMSALNFGVRSVFAQADHMRIVKRLREGMRAKVRRGKPVVPPSGYGWQAGEIFEEEAGWIRQMYAWAREGKTAHEIVTELNRLGIPRRGGARWSHSTVKYTLRNPLYKGVYQFGRARKGRGDGRDLVTCEVPAIVSPADWDATQRAIDARTRGGRPASRMDASEFGLAKRVKCGACGSTMSSATNQPREGHSRRNPYHFYYCYRIYRRDGYWGEPCPHRRYYGARKLHAQVREQLEQLQLDDLALAESTTYQPPEPVDLTPALAQIERKLTRAREAYLGDVLSLDEFAQEKRRLEEQRQALLEAQQEEASPRQLPLKEARAKIREALRKDSIAETAQDLGLSLTLYPDGRADLRIDPL
ncbi:recombinase family protein [Deinococcus peraridilitoris]|uniref:Site-specific recombinase, DNA invertase Pin n=1 Tax=Deinococcus peraridilitoris (strain DSM 19664 / LMG 22246 / CIP 109416 / KR-200) TaxID=937777 RepID=K9ZWU7_DEIPD|nr:recombinase family protein [Deinococcus peraridilitoris]AFZ66103.1 site-specific recombinase, DNA invertase Pin [Deinococcus peraridilitoris DSM 19664]